MMRHPPVDKDKPLVSIIKLLRPRFRRFHRQYLAAGTASLLMAPAIPRSCCDACCSAGVCVRLLPSHAANLPVLLMRLVQRWSRRGEGAG